MSASPGRDVVHAVLSPPELTRFREVTGLGDAALEVGFDGWSKLAILAGSRVFLFPRRGRERSLLHGARAAAAVRSLGVVVAPNVVRCWEEPDLPFAPFVEFERVEGRHWITIEYDAPYEDVERMARSLGAAIATWHGIEVAELGVELQAPPPIGPKPHLDALLAPHQVADAVHRAAELADRESSVVDAWLRALTPVSAMAPVLLHGDVCENQLFVDDSSTVTGVIDWDTAGVGHPLHDFDLGEWGRGIYAWEPRFAALRVQMWSAYVGAPGAARPWPTGAQVHLAFTLADILHVATRRRAGPLDEWGERRWRHLVAEIDLATEAACSP